MNTVYYIHLVSLYPTFHTPTVNTPLHYILLHVLAPSSGSITFNSSIFAQQVALNTCPNLDIWLAMHHSITFLLLPTWYTNFLFIYTNYIKLNSSTCFERNLLIIRRSTTQIVHMQPLVSLPSASDCLVQPLRRTPPRLHTTVTCREWRYQRLHMYNLSCWPPDDEQIALETSRGI
jgi:hypothetical protein